jgi:hypothetical protein
VSIPFEAKFHLTLKKRRKKYSRIFGCYGILLLAAFFYKKIKGLY